MGNCQAVDTATLVIQHPNGKVERFYWPVSASEVMKTNPGHYVALLISTTMRPIPTRDNNEKNCPNKSDNNTTTTTNPVRLTRIKLLKPTDTLVLGQIYRLITTQEVMKGLWAKKQAKMKKNMAESAHRSDNWTMKEKPVLEMDKASSRVSELPEQDNQVTKLHESNRPRTTASTNNNINGGSGTAKSRIWQPSLQSISEAAT